MSKPEEKLFEILKLHVPENAVHYCFDLWSSNPFSFKVTRRRNSKLGDYKHDRLRKHHTITVNHNLNPYLFLVTYIHEVAHLKATESYGLKVVPHGKEWKTIFKDLMYPILSDLVFPEDLLLPLKKHFINPKASSQSDLNLVLAMRKYDPQTDEKHLDEVKEGDRFLFKGHRYTKLNTRRTRVLCQHCDSGRKYLIPKIALVEQI